DLVQALHNLDYFFSLCFDESTGRPYYDPFLLATNVGIVLFFLLLHWTLYYQHHKDISCYIEQLVVDNVQQMGTIDGDPIQLTFDLWRMRKSVQQMMKMIRCLIKVGVRCRRNCGSL